MKFAVNVRVALDYELFVEAGSEEEAEEEAQKLIEDGFETPLSEEFLDVNAVEVVK